LSEIDNISLSSTISAKRKGFLKTPFSGHLVVESRLFGDEKQWLLSDSAGNKLGWEGLEFFRETRGKIGVLLDFELNKAGQMVREHFKKNIKDFIRTKDYLLCAHDRFLEFDTYDEAKKAGVTEGDLMRCEILYKDQTDIVKPSPAFIGSIKIQPIIDDQIRYYSPESGKTYPKRIFEFIEARTTRTKEHHDDKIRADLDTGADMTCFDKQTIALLSLDRTCDPNYTLRANGIDVQRFDDIKINLKGCDEENSRIIDVIKSPLDINLLGRDFFSQFDHEFTNKQHIWKKPSI